VDKEEDESRDEYHCGDYADVFHFEFVQISAISPTEDNEEDVVSHGECPENICQREPEQLAVNTWRVLPWIDLKFLLQTYICIKKPWNWHKAEPFPALGPLTDIIVPVTSNAL
jgi:hypothetical protein